MSYEADYINNTLTMRQVIELYKVGEFKGNHIKCPFHNERTASFSVKGNMFKCFGCGVGGDIVKFIQMYFNLDFPGVLAKLDADFNLGLGVGKKRTLREARELKKRNQACDRIRAEQRKVITDAENKYWKVFEEWKKLDEWLREYAPKSKDEQLHPLYIKALRNIERIKYKLDCAEVERKEIENANNR